MLILTWQACHDFQNLYCAFTKLKKSLVLARVWLCVTPPYAVTHYQRIDELRSSSEFYELLVLQTIHEDCAWYAEEWTVAVHEHIVLLLVEL